MVIKWILLGTLFLSISRCLCDDCRLCSDPCVLNTCPCHNATGNYTLTCATCDSRQRLTAREGVLYSHDWWEDQGKGYDAENTCSFYIESEPGTIIRLYLEFFETECSWDFLHVHDGPSPFNRTIGVFGGHLVSDWADNFLGEDQDLASSSNHLYIVFRPDKYINYDGFILTYKVDGCPGRCNGQGDCIAGQCSCHSGWRGPRCETAACSCVNGGTCEEGRCRCAAGFTGEHCQINSLDNHWQHLPSNGSSIGGRASFGGALVGSNYWVFGGHTFHGEPRVKMARYDIKTGFWHRETSSGPSDRDGHTLTAYKEWLIMFGGQKNYDVTNELWKFNTLTREWHQLNPRSRVASMGHCAVLINSTIYYLGGIGSDGAVLIDIQLYDVEADTWRITGHREMSRFRRGWVPLLYGRYGANCVHNPVTDRILVIGGMNTTSITDEIGDHGYNIFRFVFQEYDPYIKYWGSLTYHPSGNLVPLFYLGAAGLVHGRNLLLFGGKIVTPYGNCFSALPYLLNTETGESRVLESYSTDLPHLGTGRIGHQAFVYEDAVYFVGGYTGRIRDDVIVYHFGRCEDRDAANCTTRSREDYIQCAWNGTSCYSKPISECGSLKCYPPTCIPGDDFDRRCVACMRNPGCVFDQLHPDVCRDVNEISPLDHFHKNSLEYECFQARSPSKIECTEYNKCQHCKGECYWKSGKCHVNQYNNQEADCTALFKTCTAQDTCEKCQDTSPHDNCMWCELPNLNPDGSRAGQCVEKSTYYIRYPYGQCIEWTASGACKGVACSSRGNCSLCHDKAECGWCDDQSGTGTGSCLAGAYHSPNGDQMCPAPRWFYVLCPACQCNGHSFCSDGETCDRCQDHTKGTHCGTCSAGFYGDATNKGQCEECRCRTHSTGECDALSGACVCDTDGVTGPRCDECEENYAKAPSFEGLEETCLQVMSMEKRYVMSGSINKFNFIIDLDDNISDFTLNLSCDYPFELNTSLSFPGDPARTVTSGIIRGTEWKEVYQQSKYGWSVMDSARFKLFLRFEPQLNATTGAKGHLVITKRSTTQIDLSNFFGIFFGCIGVLLGVFTIAWYSKVRYYQYRTLQQYELQRTERALRPFQSHRLLFREPSTPLPGRIFEVRPLGIEALSDDRFGIVSYLLCLPGPADLNIAIASGTFMVDTSFKKSCSLSKPVTGDGGITRTSV